MFRHLISCFRNERQGRWSVLHAEVLFAAHCEGDSGAHKGVEISLHGTIGWLTEQTYERQNASGLSES